MNCQASSTIFLEDLKVGMNRSLTKRIGLAQVRMFAEVSEDYNPIHLDEDAGRNSVFKERVAHGMLSASLFSGLLGEKLPGHGTIYLGQSLRFLAPVTIGDVVAARVTVSDIDLGRKRVILSCEARVGERAVIEGEATVLAPSRG